MAELTLNDYKNKVENAWCPGCGNFGILATLQKSLLELGLPPERVLLVSGIGQAPKIVHYLNANAFDGLHGREVSSAQAAKIVADDLTVIVHSGDGGAYGEGGNHFLHAMRRNVDLTHVVHDNHIYGLTKGQASPTTDQGQKVAVHPDGVMALPMNPLALAISQSCSFVAQSLSSNAGHLQAILCEAIRHPGFSYVNVLQPCVSWDPVHTYAHYQKHCYLLDPSHDPTNQLAALAVALAHDGRIPLGVLYRNDRPALRPIAEPGVGDLRTCTDRPARLARVFDRFG
ncbi:2-oxoacid ferredoxin oxidoreductase [Myxococcota bacterium]|jgi:2-oxoglutarate ferredoxin oxidoreductase subunit beta|nr:2-oxoacid ferredoxin oxidoreductase [Myxococcota bacterium]MBU1410395.1 2-oxoacid ferredoxin oxidoreductase [Myxococcota bacterium]MBU1511832.1 2-oxoacid ferredoxin oxidoreductase [Myxococcota bacterium]